MLRKILKLSKLLKIAKQKDGKNITPCYGRTWLESITDAGLWYNTPEGTTKLLLSDNDE